MGLALKWFMDLVSGTSSRPHTTNTETLQLRSNDYNEFLIFWYEVETGAQMVQQYAGMCHLIHTPAEMNTIMCRIITENVKHRMFSLCPLQKSNNRCDFVPLSCVYLGYRGWLESYGPQPLKDELSGAAKMEKELSLIAHEHKDCSGTDHIDIMLQQQPYTISLF